MISFEAIAKQLEDSDLLEQLSKSVNANPEQVQKVARLGMPTILEALNRNSNNEKGAESLSRALDQHKGMDIDDVAGFLKGVDLEDGAKILGHVFGNNNNHIQQSIANKSGMDKSQISSLLMQFAPLVLSYLGNKKDSDALDAGGVSNLTSTVAGLFGQQGGSSLLGLASSILDNKDDDDDGGGLLGGLFNSLF